MKGEWQRQRNMDTNRDNQRQRYRDRVLSRSYDVSRPAEIVSPYMKERKGVERRRRSAFHASNLWIELHSFSCVWNLHNIKKWREIRFSDLRISSVAPRVSLPECTLFWEYISYTRVSFEGLFSQLVSNCWIYFLLEKITHCLWVCTLLRTQFTSLSIICLSYKNLFY